MNGLVGGLGPEPTGSGSGPEIVCVFQQLRHSCCVWCVGRHSEFHPVLNFDPALACIITETKYLEQLGFSVPELARNIALQVITIS